MKRREFITLLGGAAVGWPVAADAQQAERMRRIGVFLSTAANDPEGQTRLAAFLRGLQELGWTDGRNVRIDSRSGGGGAKDIHTYAAELVAVAPDAILASGSSVAGALLNLTGSIPIVFTQAPDPVGAGFVASLARPGGNATGFTNVDYAMSGKWLELLKEIEPRVRRAAIVRDPAIPAAIGQFAAIQSVAPSFGVELNPLDVPDAAAEIERAITAFARLPNGGLIVTSSGLANVHRALIITLAARHKLPAVYFCAVWFNQASGVSVNVNHGYPAALAHPALALQRKSALGARLQGHRAPAPRARPRLSDPRLARDGPG
jgi:putative tryptophan/tyrosine transport system substrate-binding protein